MSVCRSCGAPIRWARTTTGRRMPLDERPTSRGNVTLDPDGVAHVGDPTAEGERYTSHFATCPEADEWRGP